MINVWVSTKVSQGAVPGDYCWVPEGELVARYGAVCDAECPDGGGCGCGRGFAGMSTHRATTTVMVAQVDMTEAGWRAALHQTLVATGWAAAMSAPELAAFIDELVDCDLGAAAELAPGTVIGRLAYNDRDGTTHETLLDRSVLIPPGN